MSWKHTLWAGIIAVCCLRGLAIADPMIYRVDAASSATSPDGSDWDGSPGGNCFPRLSDAIALAVSGDQIWIAKGTYYPDWTSTDPTGPTPPDQDAVFRLNNGVFMLGGFKGKIGYSTSTGSERNPDAYVTILSGDLEQDDDPNEPLDDTHRDENSYTVVFVAAGAQPLTTRIDGVTIRDGNGGSQHTGASELGGAGIYVAYQAYPTINNCILKRNASPAGQGGAILFLGGGGTEVQSVVEDTYIEDNEAGTGGGISVTTAYHGIETSPGITQVSKCTLVNNRALEVGGGAVSVALESTVKVLDSTLQSNSLESTSAFQTGGGGVMSFKGGIANMKRCQLIENSVIQPQSATIYGGGGTYAAQDSMIVAVDCLIQGNQLVDTSGNTNLVGGGGAYTEHKGTSRFVNCVFRSNNAGAYAGGAAYIGSEGTVDFVNCLMTANYAWSGGAIFSDVGIVTVTNCTIAENDADITGGCVWNSSDSEGALTNSILWGNTDSDNGTDDLEAQICVNNGSGCDSSPSNVAITYSDFDDGTPDGSTPFAATNIDGNPLFDGTGDHPYQLTLNSPCIDLGINEPVPDDDQDVDEDQYTAEPTPDLKYNYRIVLGNDVVPNTEDCTGIVDMGAYEFFTLCALERYGDLNNDTYKDGLDIQPFVDCLLTDPEDQDCICERGDFVATAGPDAESAVTVEDIFGFVDCLLTGNCDSDNCTPAGGGSRIAQPDCNGNGVPDDVDIFLANGDVSLLDCNGNGIPDGCDIENGTAPDANENSIPDSCDPDCNGNDVPDDLDIAGETSSDCDSNGIPDECDPDCDNDDVPDACEMSSVTDCNSNGIYDACESDCDNDGVPDECELSGNDCNGNNFPDDCEIDFPPPWNLADCNNDDVPDVCQLSGQDCNENGIVDACDIANSVSDDENENGIPDECESESLMGGGGYSSESLSEFDEAAAWASYFEWCAATDFSSMNHAEVFSACLAKRLEFGLPAGQLLPE